MAQDPKKDILAGLRQGNPLTVAGDALVKVGGKVQDTYEAGKKYVKKLLEPPPKRPAAKPAVKKK